MPGNATTRWDDFFRQDTRVLSAPASECARFAVNEFGRRGVSRVLDLGCGVGRDSLLLADSGFSVIGADASRSGLDLARHVQSANGASVSFVEADARRLPLSDASFDAVYSFGLLHEFTGDSRHDDVTAVMREIERVLKPSGLLVLAVLAGDPSAGLPHVALFSEQMFDEATSAFRVIEKTRTADVGCTGRSDYVVWRGLFQSSAQVSGPARVR